MKLSDLRQTWSEMNRGERITLIQESQNNREKIFEARRKKKSKKKKKRKKGSKKRKTYTKPKTPEELMKMKEDMSTEEWENFKMMINLG
jgi:G3E family GTPase